MLDTFPKWVSASVVFLFIVGFPHAASATKSIYDVTAAPFGAVGNCIADDSSAIAAAISAAQSAEGGIVLLPAGCYRANVNIDNCSGITLLGVGSYDGTLVLGTRIKGSLVISPQLKKCSKFALRDFDIDAKNETNALVIDGTTQTVSHGEITNVSTHDATGDNVVIKGRAGVGAFVFDISIKRLMALSAGGRGVSIQGQVIEMTLDHPYVDYNAGVQIAADGGPTAQISDLVMIQPTVGGGTYGFQLRDMERFTILGPHIEYAGVGQILLQSANNGSIFGDGYVYQVGNAEGIVFDSGVSGIGNQNIRIDLPGWANDTTNSKLHYIGGYMANVRLGSSSSGPLTPADMVGTPFCNSKYCLMYDSEPLMSAALIGTSTISSDATSPHTVTLPNANVYIPALIQPTGGTNLEAHLDGAGAPATSGTRQIAPLRVSSSFNGMVMDSGFYASTRMAWTQTASQQALGVSYPWALNPNGGHILIGTGLDCGSTLCVGALPVKPTLSGTTGPLPGSAIPPGACVKLTASVNGATSGMETHATPASYTQLSPGLRWDTAYVSNLATVTVPVCNTTAVSIAPNITPVFNVRVIQ